MELEHSDVGQRAALPEPLRQQLAVDVRQRGVAEVGIVDGGQLVPLELEPLEPVLAVLSRVAASIGSGIKATADALKPVGAKVYEFIEFIGVKVSEFMDVLVKGVTSLWQFLTAAARWGRARR